MPRDDVALLRTRLGPDALHITVSDLRTRLAGRKCPIKHGLMDQTVIAGIGSIYASEILHQARISPLRPCDRLSLSQWKRLGEAMQSILEEAIRYEGSTLSDGTYRSALNRRGRYQARHRVYGREGRPCKTCWRGRGRRVVQQQRATFFCPVWRRLARRP